MTIADSEKPIDETKEKSINLCEKEKVLEAVTVLKAVNKKFLEDESKKQPLLDEAADSPIFLQVTMKKIPPKKMIKRIKVSLPHSLMTNTAEVCLFTGDLDKRNKKAEVDPDVLHYKEFLKKQGITNVNEVITLRQLRTEYKVYEARRQLMAAYDVFLCDKKIAQCLPRILGKIFIKKRKFPIQINMNTSNLKSQVDKALSETVFAVTCRGNSCASEVARLGMEEDKILENIVSSIKVVANQLPGEENNISGIYIKTAKSQAIPIFMSFGNTNDVKIQKPHSREKVKLEELSTLPNAEVKVFRDGRIVVKKTKVGEGNTDAVEKIKPHKGKRKRESNEDQSEGIVEVKDEMSSDEIESVVEVNKSRSKKKRKLNEDQGVTESDVAQLMGEDAEEDSKKTKSKKKRKISENNKDQESIESGTELKGEDTVEDARKKSKRSKKNKDQESVEKSTEFIGGDVEENANKSKSRKKQKLNVKNKDPEANESKGTEFVVEDVEENANKTKSKKKHKKNKDQEVIESGVTEFKGEDNEKITSPTKTKSKKKRKGAAESVEAEESKTAATVPLEIEPKIEKVEKDSSLIKTRLRSRGNLKKSSPKVKNTKKAQAKIKS